MLLNNKVNGLKHIQSRDNRPGRTRIQPADEFNSVLRTYCSDDQEFSPSVIRSIGNAITKLSDNKLLYTADQELIYNFLKIQNDSLKNQNYPFEMIEISLKILAEPDMSLMLYNNEWIQNIIDILSNICNDMFQKKEKKTQIHNLYSIYRHLSYVIHQINLPDSALYKLISLALPAYFHPASSPPLQAASCSLLVSIFKKHPSLRNDIMLEIFSAAEKNQGSSKYVSFAKNVRKSISAITILLIELIQSISSFPCDTLNITQEIINLIVQTFITRSKNSSIFGKLFEKFIDDICSLVAHPFYPISRILLKNTLEALFPSVSKKDENTRISIKLICIALKNILKFTQKAKENAIIAFPKPILDSLAGYNEDKIQEQFKDPEANISEVEDDICAINLSSTFPRSAFEELTAHFIISLYLHQTMKLTEVINNALQFNITLWSTKKLSQEEMDNYHLWWKGMLPSNIAFEWTIDIAEQICLHEISKLPMFSHVHFLVQHLLKGLENKNSNVRSMILRGLSGIIEIDPDLLFHPSLVSQINEAFKDPSAPIRDSVLQIISKYIIQNEQSSSPYFSVVINCLTDSSPMVVKRALGIVGQLSKISSDESLSKLSYLLSTKLNDESSNVAKAAKNALIQVLFEDAKDPTLVLATAVSKTQGRPLWFPQFMIPLYTKQNVSKIELMIQKSFENANNSPTYANCCLVREFCDAFPKLCASQHEIIISIINSCTNDNILSILPSALNSILNDITNPNVTLFTLLMQSIQKFIYSKSALIIRSVIELGAQISLEILGANDILENTFDNFATFLKNNLNFAKQKVFVETPESSKLVNHICRALYIIGCLCRFDRTLTQTQVNQAFVTIENYFKAPVPKIRSMVLQSACDLCIRDSSQIQKAKELVTKSFKLGPPENISGILFLKNLIEEESNTEDPNENNENKATYSSNLVNDFMQEIKKCFSYKDSAIRSAALEFTKIALTYGAINPPDIIPHIISMLCSSEQSNLALETVKIIIYHYSTFFNNRMKDGIYEAFNYVMSIYGPGFTSLSSNDYSFHIGDLMNVLQPPQKSLFLSAFTDILQDAFSTNADPYWVNWIIRSICNFPFTYIWELSIIMNNLNSNVLSAHINSAYADAKAIIHSYQDDQSDIETQGANQSVWYTSILVLKAKQWLSKKYQIQQKKLKNNETDKKTPLKVAIIQPISLGNIPIPDQNNEINDSALSLFTQFQSTMRTERSFD